jgi:hypothetical protein
VGSSISHPDQAEETGDTLSESIQEWIDSLAALDVRALTVLGPCSADQVDLREVWASHPPSYRQVAEAFASSDAYGPRWRDSNSPAMAWQNIGDDDNGTRRRSL